MVVQFQYHQIILMIQSEFKDRYYGVVLKLIQNGKQARVQWIEDNPKSIEDIDIDNISSLRQKYLKNRKSLYYASSPRIKVMMFNLKGKTWPPEIHQPQVSPSAFVIC